MESYTITFFLKNKQKKLFSILFLLATFCPVFKSYAQCTSPTVNTGTTTITPTTAWQTVVMASGAVRYVEFAATAGNSYVFTCNSTVGGSTASDEQFSILTTSNVADGGVYTTSWMDSYNSSTKERIIWSPSSSATYRLVLSKYASLSNCQALSANATIAYTYFVGTQNFAFWTGFTSTDFETNGNWFRRTTTSYPSESIPVTADAVTITSGSSNAPTYPHNTDHDIGDLTINSGATLNYVSNAGFLIVHGNFTNNGTFNHTGDNYVMLIGSGKTFGGTGNFFANVASPFYFEDGSSYTLQNSITVRHIYINTTGSLDMNGYDITTEFFFQVGTLYLRTGTLNIWGSSDASAWLNPGDNINPYFSTDGNFVPATGTVFYCAGNAYTASNQTVRTTTYYNLKIQTQSGYTATVGTSAATTVSNDLTFVNTSTAGGVATLAYDITVGNNLNIGATGNALTLNLPYRMYRGSGTGTITMGNVSAHAINITYAHATNLCITGFGTPTFYGTVTYNSASGQQVTGAVYNNLTFSSAGTKTLAAAIDVNGILTMNAGTLDTGSGLNYAISLAGDWVRASAATFTARSGTVTFDGAATQRINVTAAAGTTPTNSDITFYNVVVDGSDVKLYYDKTNDRYFNTTDFTINSSKTAYLIGN